MEPKPQTDASVLSVILRLQLQPSAAMPKPLSLAAVNAAKAAALQASAEGNEEAAALPAPTAVAALPAPEGAFLTRCMQIVQGGKGLRIFEICFMQILIPSHLFAQQ